MLRITDISSSRLIFLLRSPAPPALIARIRYLGIVSVMIITMLSTSIAYGQSPITGDGIEISDVMTLENIGVILSAFILAAIAWSVLGWQKRRSTVKTPIDPKKLLTTRVIGMGRGVAVFVYALFIGD